MQGFAEFNEEKKITVKTKMGGEIPATIKVTGKDYHIVKTDSGKQYKVDHQGNSLEEEIELSEEDLVEDQFSESKMSSSVEKATWAHERGDHRQRDYHIRDAISKTKNKKFAKAMHQAYAMNDIGDWRGKDHYLKVADSHATKPKHKDFIDKFKQMTNEEVVTEKTDKDLPFTPDKKKTKLSTPGKYGSAYSTVRNLARQAMQKQAAKKNVKEEGGKITVDEETLIEKLDKKEELRAALNRHSQHAIEANRRGDDEAVKVHQSYMNKIKDKMAKLVRNEELVGKQHKLDVDKDGKIEGEDLAKLRKMKEEAELQESSDAHKVMVTVSDPNHPAVSQRKEQIMKHVIVRAGDKGDAQAKAEAFYKKRGYKVHGSEYHSKQPATSMKTEEVELEEASKGYAPGWMLKADPELAKKVKEKTQGYKDLKKYAGRDIPKKEELDMKTFSQFMEEIQEIEEAKKDEPSAPNADAIAKRKAREAAARRREEKAEADKDDLSKDYKPTNAPKSTTKVIAGRAYGGAAQKDDEDETHPVTQKATEKRGRGRPAGSKSGARTAGAAKKSYGGLTFHSLSLPNSNK